MAADARVELVCGYSLRPMLPIRHSMKRALARLRSMTNPSRTLAIVVVASTCSAILASASGFGATSTTQNPSANVVGMLALTDPVALGAAPPVCTDAVSPLDTDDCTDVSFTPGASKVLSLGALSGTDVQAGSLTWQVTTTNAAGYQVRMSNAGTAPLLKSTSGSIADMQTSPLVPASAVASATHFGVAMGNPASDNESAVSFPGSPWVAAGQQGELFSGIPTTGMVIAERGTPQTNDPFTATFAAAAIASQPPAPGSYSGTVRVVASAI
jgi:hypothetical protein